MRPEGDPPVCDCHKESMYWSTDYSKTKGGVWRCAVKVRERVRNRRAFIRVDANCATRKASLRVAHQKDCPNANKTTLDSVSGDCACKNGPSYYTFHRGQDGRPVKGARVKSLPVAERSLRIIQREIDIARGVVPDDVQISKDEQRWRDFLESQYLEREQSLLNRVSELEEELASIRERRRARDERHAPKRKERDERKRRTDIANTVDTDPLIQDVIYNPKTQTLRARLTKIAARLESSNFQGERDNAARQYRTVYQQLEQLVSNRPGGKAWLQRQTISAEMRNTQHATKSLPVSASSRGA